MLASAGGLTGGLKGFESHQPGAETPMPSLTNLLASKAVLSLLPGEHPDGNGLWLIVRPSGARSWLLRFSHLGRKREMGLGAPPQVGLGAARDAAREAKKLAREGVDPIAERDARRAAAAAPVPKVQTFGEFADAYVETHKVSWRGAKTEARWKLALTVYAAPLRERGVDDIEPGDVAAALAPAWMEKQEISDKAQTYLERVFDAAIACGARTKPNPARWKGLLQELLPRHNGMKAQHHPSLPYALAPAFIASLRSRRGVAARALELTVLTATRTAEVIGARWCEIDLEAAVWSVPLVRVKAAEAMHKAGFNAFRVALSAPAVALLRARREEAEEDAAGALAHDSYVFPSPADADAPLSNGGMERVLDRMKMSHVTVHGFRSTFRTWAGQQMVTLPDGDEVRRFSDEALESALGHVVGTPVQRAYARDDYLKPRVKVMAAWANYLAQGPAAVVDAPMAMRMVGEKAA